MEPDIQSRIHEWAENVFGSPTHVEPLYERIVEEMQELEEALDIDIMVLDRTVDEIKWYDYPTKQKVSKELADVAITLFRLASVLEIDLLKEVSLKQDVNERRQWEAHGDGTGHHIKNA